MIAKPILHNSNIFCLNDQHYNYIILGAIKCICFPLGVLWVYAGQLHIFHIVNFGTFFHEMSMCVANSYLFGGRLGC